MKEGGLDAKLEGYTLVDKNYLESMAVYGLDTQLPLLLHNQDTLDRARPWTVIKARGLDTLYRLTPECSGTQLAAHAASSVPTRGNR
jgi:hypothetical protein